MRLVGLALVALALGAPAPRPAPHPAASVAEPVAPPHTDRFDVSASVGGVERSNLRDIGKATLQYVELPKAFRMRGVAQVEHREKHNVYRFQLDMTFRLEGRRLEVVENRNRFPGDAAEVRDKVERAVPFLYLLRALPVPPEADEQSRSYLAKHGYFVVRYARRETNVEAALYRDDELVGKFWLAPHPGAANDLDRIEIPASESVMVVFKRKTGP